MTETDVPTPTEPALAELELLRQRLVTFGQTRGLLGKSFFAEVVHCWAQFAEIPHALIDADRVNRTLSSRYPNHAISLPALDNDHQFARMLDALPAEAPLVVLDVPAQSASYLVEAVHRLDLLEVWKKQGTRLTIVLFVVNDVMAIKTADVAHKNFGDGVDYLLVENPVDKPEWEKFYRSPVGQRLLEEQTPVVRMPTLTTATLTAWGAAQAKAKRHLGLAEAIEAPALTGYNRHELQHFCNTMYYQLEGVASRLLPDPSLIKNRTAAPKATRALAEPAEFFDVV